MTGCNFLAFGSYETIWKGVESTVLDWYPWLLDPLRDMVVMNHGTADGYLCQKMSDKEHNSELSKVLVGCLCLSTGSRTSPWSSTSTWIPNFLLHLSCNVLSSFSFAKFKVQSYRNDIRSILTCGNSEDLCDAVCVPVAGALLLSPLHAATSSWLWVAWYFRLGTLSQSVSLGTLGIKRDMHVKPTSTDNPEEIVRLLTQLMLLKGFLSCPDLPGCEKLCVTPVQKKLAEGPPTDFDLCWPWHRPFAAWTRPSLHGEGLEPCCLRPDRDAGHIWMGAAASGQGWLTGNYLSCVSLIFFYVAGFASWCESVTHLLFKRQWVSDFFKIF